MLETLEENLLGERLRGYGGIDLDHQIYFLYTPSNTTVRSFLEKVGNRKSFKKFIESIQNAFSGIETTNVDKTYKDTYRARRTGRALSILNIEECTKYIMSNALSKYLLESENPGLKKVRDYCNEFDIEFFE